MLLPDASANSQVSHLKAESALEVKYYKERRALCSIKEELKIVWL